MYNKRYELTEKTAPTDSYKYGNSFTWDGSNYTLTDTVDSVGAPSNVSTHHYTCFNDNGVCSSVSYIYFVYLKNIYYINLTEGKTGEDAINEMLYNDDVNKNDSAIKTAVDKWYENNMLEYTNYLEDTVWCNDRSSNNFEESSWNSNGGNGYLLLKSNSDKENLTCKNKNDRFTVNKENGNGALKYPVGMIDATEMNLSYINDKSSNTTGNNFWTMSPNCISLNSSYNFYILTDGSFYNLPSNTPGGIHPSVSLKSGTVYISGDGSVENPYVIPTN